MGMRHEGFRNVVRLFGKEPLSYKAIAQVDAYWEQTDKKTGEGNGIYYKATQALDDPAYVSYIVAVR